MKTLLRRFPLFVLLVVLLSLPPALNLHYAVFIDVRRVLFAGAESIVFAWLGCCLVERFPKWWMRSLVVGIPSFLFFVEMFCFFHFGTRFGLDTLGLVLQTSPKEASGFVAHYLLTLNTLYALFATAALVALWLVAARFWKVPSGKFFSSRWVAWVWDGIVVLSAAMCIAVMAGVPLFPERFMVHNNTVLQIPKSYIILRSAVPDFSALEAAQKRVEVHPASACAPTVILVIGESHNRNHSSVYGYRFPTTPWQQEALDKGELVAFTDIVARFEYTAECLPQIFSPAPLGSEEIYSTPLFPAIFRKAGYEVVYFDNQSTRHGSIIWSDFASSAFLNAPGVDSLNFDVRNDRIFDYDGQLLDALLPKINFSRPQLIVFHINGQHEPARDKYPPEMARFSASQYEGHPFLPGQKERREMAEYDNAVLYTDRLLRSLAVQASKANAVMVYTSDHGEEVYDSRVQYGRKQTPTSVHEAHSLFEVPLEVWMSETYRRANPEIVKELAAASSRSGYNSDIPHMLMRLAGLRTPLLNSSLCILDSAYVDPRPRVIGTGYDYDNDRPL